jgi:outer membrane scaffolding protein for murein synthesis (MipA/OmpV family)
MPLRRAHLGRLTLLAIATLLPAVASPPAAAQDSSPFDVFGGGWQAGGLVFVSPKFEGARSYGVIGFPFVAPAGLDDNGTVQVKAGDDIRFRVLQLGGFELGPLAGYRFGRDEDDAAHLDGMGDVDGGLVLGGFAAYRTGPLAVSLSYHHQATGDDAGALVRLAGEYALRPAPGFRLTASLGTNYATEAYMDAFFGVTATQAANSGLPFHAPEAGFKDVFVGAKLDMALDKRWTLHLLGRYARLVGDAADSPVIETENQFYGGAALTYRFDLGR